ncbi:MAG TPA: FAD:protein FMN transferase [Lentisphaeria bacterium]|nr:FAD:protein FMN transferase [Lentisphaeria bacterium]
MSTSPATSFLRSGLFRRIIRYAVILCLGCALAYLAYLRRPAPAPAGPTHEYHFFVFNTACNLQVWGDVPSVQANDAFRELNTVLQNLHDTINIFSPDSELSRLNQQAHDHPVVCSETLWDIIKAAEEAWRLTDGAFDVTVGPLMQTWGFHGQAAALPSEADITVARQKVGFDKLTLDQDQRSVFFPIPGMRLDFGGLAKGYALEASNVVLSRHGLKVFLLDLGGNILASTKTPAPGQPFLVGIRDPRSPDRLAATLELQGACISTSGNYQRFRLIDGKKVGHLMDPRTGRPGDFWAGVTVRTPLGLHSDVFSTAVFIGGTNLAQKLAKRYPRTGFLLLRDSPDQETLPQETIGDLKIVTPTGMTHLQQ